MEFRNEPPGSELFSLVPTCRLRQKGVRAVPKSYFTSMPHPKQAEQDNENERDHQ